MSAAPGALRHAVPAAPLMVASEVPQELHTIDVISLTTALSLAKPMKVSDNIGNAREMQRILDKLNNSLSSVGVPMNLLNINTLNICLCYLNDPQNKPPTKTEQEIYKKQAESWASKVTNKLTIENQQRQVKDLTTYKNSTDMLILYDYHMNILKQNEILTAILLAFLVRVFPAGGIATTDTHLRAVSDDYVTSALNSSVAIVSEKTDIFQRDIAYFKRFHTIQLVLNKKYKLTDSQDMQVLSDQLNDSTAAPRFN